MKQIGNLIGYSIITVALTGLAVLAADRVGMWTKATRVIETRWVNRVISDYDDKGNLLSMQIGYITKTADTNGVVLGLTGSSFTWTRENMARLPASQFGTALTNRWISGDAIPETTVLGWKNPEWSTPTNIPPAEVPPEP